MKLSLASYWESIRTSFWFIPTLMTLGAILFSGLALWGDRNFVNIIPLDSWWIYSGGADGARAVLAAISGSMITVTSVVFSITIVTLTLASGQFGSRLLRNFMRDTGNQVVLGTFIATFIYSLLILRSVRSIDENVFIPYISVTFGVLLVFLSVGVLIFFIHHVSTKIQAENIVNTVFEEASLAVDRLFPQSTSDQNRSDQAEIKSLPKSFKQEAVAIKSKESNYLQVIGQEDLLQLTEKNDLIISLAYRPGDFIIKGTALMYVWPSDNIDNKLSKKLSENLILGGNKTLTQNAEYGLQQLVEIAVRALSPGINDPFTAINCIDRLAALLCQISSKVFPPQYRFDKAGNLRIKFIATSFEGYVNTSFNQIRQNAQTNPAVLIRMMEAINTIITHTTIPDRIMSLKNHANMIKNAADKSFKEVQDQSELESRYRKLMNL